MVRVHGNWCGPNWTDGQAITAAEHKARGGTSENRARISWTVHVARMTKIAAVNKVVLAKQMRS